MTPVPPPFRALIRPAGALALLALALLSPGQSARAAELIITVVNLATDKGHMKAALFDEAAQFPRGRQRAGLTVPVTGKTVRLVFTGLVPGGRYAVAVYHDENDNGKFDQAFLDFPLEAFGFSRDASVITGTPHFNDSVFRMKGEKMELTITLKHSVFD